jgi:capsular polysaccharide biosynthesis protein
MSGPSRLSRLLAPQVCVAIALLILITGTAFTLTLPKQYLGTCMIQLVFPEGSGARFDASAVQALTRTQAQLITTKPVFYEVIEHLNLQSVWGERVMDNGQALTRDDARQILESSVKVLVPERVIGLIEILVFREDPEEAARIANELSAVYRDQLATQPQPVKGLIVKVVDPAEPPLKPVSPNMVLNIGICAALGVLVMVIGLIFGGTSAQTGPRPPPLT